MSFLLVAQRALTVPGWVKNALWRAAKATPSLDLPFADSKSLVDAITGRQLVTFARASSGTYVDSAGVLSTATTNLLLRSEEFDSAPWASQSTPPTITANTAVSPNGTLTADTITFASADSRLQSDTISFTAGVAYTFSIYAKAVGTSLNRFRLAFFDGAQQNSADFTVSNLTWTRITATFIAANTAAGRVQIRNATDVLANSLFFWGAQLEQSSTVGEYIPTGSTINSAPRFDHNPLTGESLGLLVEEQRTNSIRNNTMVGAVAGTPGTVPTNWGDAPTSNGLNRQIVGIGTQNGITYIDIRYSGTTTATASLVVQPELGAVTVAATGQSWTASSWLALAGGSTSGMTIVQRVTGRSSVGGFLENSDTSVALSSTLTRYAASITMANASTLRVSSDIVLSYSSGAVVDITLRIGLPQLEQGATVSSVIPTTTAAATRNADVASITGTNFSSWYRQDEGTVYADYATAQTQSGSFPGVASISDGSNSNRIQLSHVSGNRRAVVSSGGSAQFDIQPGAAIANVSARFALSYRAADFATCVNAGTVTAQLSGTVPTTSRLNIGADAAGANQLNGHIRRLTFWPQALPGQLQAITQP